MISTILESENALLFFPRHHGREGKPQPASVSQLLIYCGEAG